MRIVALFLIVALAGCLGGDDAGTNDGHGNEGNEGQGNGGHGNEGNEGHVDDRYDVTFLNGSFVANVTDGFVPLSVTFTIDANYVLNGTEAFPNGRDEKAISDINGSFLWTFDQNGDGTPEAEGTEVPFNLTVLYAEAGNFTSSVHMEGQNLTYDASVVIATETFIPPIPPTIYEGIVQEPCPQCTPEQGGFSYSFSHLADTINIDATWSELPSDLGGAPFVATTTAGLVGVSFQDSCNGAEVEKIAPAKTIVGTVPEGAGCVWMWEDSEVRGSKLSFIAHGDLTMLPDDGLCWAPDGVLVGQSQGTGVYLTDGTWFYAETNGIPGLQWSNDVSPGLGEVHKPDCEGGDLMII